jgi:hypothetical protein
MKGRVEGGARARARVSYNASCARWAVFGCSNDTVF